MCRYEKYFYYTRIQMVTTRVTSFNSFCLYLTSNCFFLIQKLKSNLGQTYSSHKIYLRRKYSSKTMNELFEITSRVCRRSVIKRKPLQEHNSVLKLLPILSHLISQSISRHSLNHILLKIVTLYKLNKN